MKKIALFSLTFFVAVTAIVISCTKAVKVPVSYTVVTNHDTVVRDIFIPDSGQFDMQVLVKYMSGYPQDPVTLKITGLPSEITVTPDTVKAIPTYTEDFIFHTNHATHATYHVSIVGTAPEELSQTFNFNVTVIPADCATALIGTLNGSNACTNTGNYTYTSTGASSGTPNTLIINNFGGYGTTANATVILNCDNDSLTIPEQTIGNGATLQGRGTFTATGMVIYYSATSLPIGGSDNCTITYTNCRK